MIFDVCYGFVSPQVHHKSSVAISPNKVYLMLTIASCSIFSSNFFCLFNVTCTVDQRCRQKKYYWKVQELRKIRLLYNFVGVVCNICKVT